MKARSALLPVGLLAGCANVLAPQAASPPAAFAPAQSPAPSTPASASAAFAPDPPTEPPPDFATDRRQVLGEMVSFDTSHGGETKLLEPIAARYRAAGVPVRIVESAPGRGNLIARLKGAGTKSPLLLLAHVDVVPVSGQSWSVPPFALTERDGFLWGRGVNDDKGMASTIVAVTLELARQHAPLCRDVIVLLSAGEETGGTEGVRWLAENHREWIDAAVALNEGGAALLNDDGSKAIVVGVGVSEKTFQTFHVTTHGKGGHSSRPPTAGDPVVALARAIVKIGEHRFPARILAETKASFEAQIDTAEPAYSPALRRAVRSAPNIAPADDALLSKDAGYNAELRTTCVTTMLEAAAQDNVLPTRVEAAVNCRILPGETRESVRDALVKAIGDPNVDVAMGADLGTSAPSPFEGEVVVAVQKAAANMFPGAPVVPTMSTGATDSRHLRRIGIAAFGVAPLAVTRAEARAGHVAHGPDERSSLRWFTPMGEYFRSIVRSLALAQPDAAPAALPAK